MNNPNPFVPKGSLLEQQSRRRSRLKLGVFCVLAVGICGLAAMLIQGCKREESDQNADNNNNQPPVDTNNYAEDTNTTPVEASNPPVAVTVPTPAPAPAPEPAPAPAPAEYVVVKGDTLGKIATANGVSLKALEEANPDAKPRSLKVGQKLVIPAGATTGSGVAAQTENGVADNGGQEVYVVKSGDTLGHLSRHFGVSVKAIQEANNLSTTMIHVGQKLTIPAKPETEPAPVNTPPATTTSPAPAPAPAPAPDTTPAPATSNPPGQ